jgi:hypothetical protein
MAVLGACGSGKGKERDAAEARLDAGVRVPDGGVRISDGGSGGRVKVRVEWKDAPAAMRASPGRDGCGEQRPGYARVHTLQGVADVVVWIEGESGAPPDRPATVTVRRCHLEPAVQIGVGELRVTSLVEGRVSISIDSTDALDGPAKQDEVAELVLPVVGHTAAVAIAPWVTRVHADVAADPAYVVTPPVPHAAVTDDTGAAMFDGVSEGEHGIVAFLHAGADQPARMVRGTVTVKAGEAVDVVLSLVPGAVAPVDEPEPEPEP